MPYLISFFLTLRFNFNVMEKYSQVIFDKNTVEFVTVAAEFCGFLERAREIGRAHV